MSAIYCYVNKLNKKKYVGQTNNIKRRYNEHKSDAYNSKSSSYNLPISNAIRKYGLENFDFTILEDNIDNQNIIDKRERYWIKDQRSLVSEWGYNILNGGQSNFSCSRLKRDEIEDIKMMIKEGRPYNDIVNKYLISKSYISMINSGLIFSSSEEKYPLKEYRLNEDILEALIQMLEESELSFTKIAKILNISESTVKKINYGTLRPNLVESYPIRKISPANKKAENVKYLLLNTNYSREEILTKVKISNTTLNRINKGETHKDNNLTYPLRNFVEAIRG